MSIVHIHNTCTVHCMLLYNCTIHVMSIIDCNTLTLLQFIHVVIKKGKERERERERELERELERERDLLQPEPDHPS